jgi:glycosyltransferase involved in cell wall biosynthesis
MKPVEGTVTVRIGIDARHAFRETHGGVGAYVAALLEHLPAVGNGADEFLAYLDRSSETEGLDGVHFHIRRLPVPTPFLWREAALPLAASRDHLDLLHLPSHVGPTWTPCPTVYTIHDPSEFVRIAQHPSRQSFQHTLGRFMRIGTLPLQAKAARRIITASDASRLDLIRVLGLEADRIHVIPLGVAPDLEPALNPILVREGLWQAGYPVPNRFVLALGDADPGQSGLNLMRSFARMHDLIPGVHLWIIGVERPEAYAIPFPTHPQWLTILGEVPRRALVSLFQAATVFVFLSEGFGLPVLEAMSCGVPVLAPNRPSLAEVTRGGAVLFDPLSEDDLAGALVRVLTDDAIRSACIQAGRAHASRFSELEMVRRTYGVYREAVYEAAREAAEDDA